MKIRTIFPRGKLQNECIIIHT